MKTSIVVAACLVVIALPACKPKPQPESGASPQTRVVAPVLHGEEARDIHSFAQPATARVTHVDLDLVADFAAHTFSGTATLEVETRADGNILTLDTSRLTIESVTDSDGNALSWKLGEVDPVLGSPLRVELGTARSVVVHYRTDPDAEALQWLPPELTAGKQKPYLLSQGEAILTRTWVPTQDSPAIRQTWTARIVAPEDLTVVMSAEMLGSESSTTPGMRAWRFRMEQPVAPYLIAITIGDLAFQSLGKRTGVYTEPSMLAGAATEFADLERMVEAAEALYGPYRWGRYDLLILPPSFPFGGMENPRLSFITPTIIAGDKSLVNLVAHELAHSWSGNLITNATWADFWLNEGFTVYFQNRIMESVYGKEAAAMEADLGWDEMQADITDLDKADTRLHLELAGRNPDDGMTEIAYEKGAVFLRTIEAAVGRERWDAYLRDYFDRYAFRTQTSAGFLEDLRANLIKGDAALEKQLELDNWVYQPGLPANASRIQSEAFKRIDAAAATFAARGATGLDVTAWSTAERVRFLNRLPRKLNAMQLGSVSDLFKVTQQRNSEVRFAWLRLAIANRYPPSEAQVEEFLLSMGRRKFVLPLFTDLMAQGEWGQTIARRVYAEARPGYHSVTTGSVDKVVPLPAGQ